jgi:hypothetical protein
VASPDKRSFLIRVQPEILAAAEHLAAAELRSVNAQIEILLREALTRRGVWKVETIPERKVRRR